VCNAKGNVFTFIQKYKKISFLEAVKEVAIKINYDLSIFEKQSKNTILDPKIKRLIDANKQVNEWYQDFLYDKNNNFALQYLYDRGFDDSLIKHFQIGYAPSQHDLIYQMMSNANHMFGNDREQNLI